MRHHKQRQEIVRCSCCGVSFKISQKHRELQIQKHLLECPSNMAMVGI